jgi:hypothetical protein
VEGRVFVIVPFRFRAACRHGHEGVPPGLWVELPIDDRTAVSQFGRVEVRTNPTGPSSMTRNMFATACLLLISVSPVVAQSTSVVRRVPAPEADAGLLALVMVGGVALLTYWRKRRHS